MSSQGYPLGGPHPTIAGNMLDPRINADGAKSGLGVGGAAEPVVRAEGAEHLGGTSSAYANTGGYQSTGGISSDYASTGGNQSTGGIGSHSASTSAGPPPVDEPTDKSSGGFHVRDENITKDSHGKAFGHVATEQEALNDGDGKGGPPPSIPTAGGERIGTKHWGESKIIPAYPKVEGESTSVKDDLTKTNTDKNTTTGSHSTSTTEEKESTLDKIKDKLHISHK